MFLLPDGDPEELDSATTPDSLRGERESLKSIYTEQYKNEINPKLNTETQWVINTLSILLVL